jgi:hypothetical protein
MAKYTVADFEQVIPGTGGIITTIASKMGCTWHTAAKHIKGSPKLKELVEGEANKIDDMAESVVINAIKDKDVQTAKWWLERRKRAVFATRQEITGEEGGEITIRVVYDDK